VALHGPDALNPHAARPLLGIGLVLAATASFALLDTLTQRLTASVSVAMIIWLRYLVQMLSALALDLPRRGRALLRARQPGLQLARGLALAATNTLAVLSLQHIPVGEYTAIVMLTPIALTLVSVMVLGERVSVLRWLMVAGGFAGAMIVVRPGGEDFNLGLLLPVGTLLANTAFQWLTARLAGQDEAGTTNFYTAALGTLLGSVALALSGWPHLGAALWGLLALVAVLNSLGHMLLILAYGQAPATVVAPFLYFQISFAALAGWALLGQTPDVGVAAGIALITLCGVVGSLLNRPAQG
jgi:drug/metabolite transporter (DMT)-like permease